MIRQIMAAAGLAAVATLGATPGLAQRALLPRDATVTVTGTATVRTPPDVATVSYSIRGEGSTSDAAVREMAERSRRIEAALRRLSPDLLSIHTGAVAVGEARSPTCRMNDDDQPVTATGPCAVTGYVASLDASAEVAAAQAGTAAGVVTRSGATGARAGSSRLSDARPAQRRAYVAAVEQAQQQASVLAAAAGARLGPVQSIDDSTPSGGEDIVVTAQRRSEVDTLTDQIAPVVVDVHPPEVETSARITATFQLLR